MYTLCIHNGQKKVFFAVDCFILWIEFWEYLDNGNCHGISPEKDGNISVLNDVAADNTSPSSHIGLFSVKVIQTVYDSSCEVGDEIVDEKS